MLNVFIFLVIPFALFHLNGNANMVGVALENLFNCPVLQKIIVALGLWILRLLWPQMQNHIGATAWFINRLDTKFARAI